LAESEAALQPLVKIDDFTVTNLHFVEFANQTGRKPQDPQGQVSLLNELVNSFMVANSKQGRALENDPEVAAALEVARARLVTQAFVQTQLDQQPVDETRLKQLYAAEHAKTRPEFKARHILLQSEDEAMAVIAELDGGADFATLASERSTGPSKSVGGDLGWFESEHMVAEFSQATAQLSDGSYSKTPVKTRFGWHVILREDSRELPPTDFETLRPELEKQIQRQQIAEVIGEIRKNTRIEAQE
jgi:peptidyl-prolyl cis-trans isomerase C